MASVRPASIIGLAVLALLGPWVARNAVALGRPVIGSTLTGYNLYRNNYMLATDNYLRFVGPDEGEAAIKALIAQRPDLRGTENEAQMEAVYRTEALHLIAANPVQYALLSVYRFLPLWFNWQFREAYGEHSRAVDYVMMAQQAFLLITALLGLRGNGSQAWPLAAGAVFFSLAHMAVVAQMRFVIPVMPMVTSLSAAGILQWVQLRRVNQAPYATVTADGRLHGHRRPRTA
jgi:hypothetical protein